MNRPSKYTYAAVFTPEAVVHTASASRSWKAASAREAALMMICLSSVSSIRSISLINGSLLLQADERYCCTSSLARSSVDEVIK